VKLYPFEILPVLYS